jgi:hypothetical protein
MRKIVVMLVLALTFALGARASFTMAMHDGMSDMAGDCAGICAPGHASSAASDCVDHCLAAGTLHPIEGMAASLLFLLSLTAAFVALFAVRDDAFAETPRGRPPDRGKRYALALVASDILRE